MPPDVPRHPWWENALGHPAPAVLDEIPSSGDDELTHLLGDVPRAVFAGLLDAAPPLPAPAAWWLLHMAGYHGGVWLRAAIAHAQPEAPLLQLSVVPTEDAFRTQIAAATDAVAAAHHEPLEHLEARLLTVEPPGLVDTFGYNEGYLREIVDRPPEGLHAPVGFEVVALEPVPPVRAEPVEAVRAAAHRRGREVWSTGLSVQGFTQSEYLTLLRLSDTFLRLARDVTVAALTASSTGDAVGAERVGVADAHLAFWLASYISGLLDGG